MNFKKTAFGLFLALSIPTTSTAQDVYYDPYSMASCLGVFSPAFTPSPDLKLVLDGTAHPRRLSTIARARMSDAVNAHRAEQCMAMKQGLEPQPCPVGDTVVFDIFLEEAISEFAGADMATVEAAVRAEVGGPSGTDVLEACKK